ncbi:MAG: hypothetical protein LWW98_07830 [Deltaproteobacteria bacterium]|nr:hypothetical protein [Deltaproteobacteria bacterium]
MLNARLIIKPTPYLHEVPGENWEKLLNVLQSQETTIRNSIMNEEGPLKKENAENALNSLFSAIEDYLWQNTLKTA